MDPPEFWAATVALKPMVAREIIAGASLRKGEVIFILQYY
jgi:hypothetical protein